MFPIGDDNEGTAGIAFVTIALIALNVLAFLVEMSQPSEAALQSFIYGLGRRAARVPAGQDLPPRIPFPFWTTLLTSMFLHGGWGHLLRQHAVPLDLRRQHRAASSATCGSWSSTCLRPRGRARAHRVQPAARRSRRSARRARSAASSAAICCCSRATASRADLGRRHATVPAMFMLGFWILIQFINGVGAVANTPETGGVAYLAHIGGFVAGLVLAPIWSRPRRQSPSGRLPGLVSRPWRVFSALAISGGSSARRPKSCRGRGFRPRRRRFLAVPDEIVGADRLGPRGAGVEHRANQPRRAFEDVLGAARPSTPQHPSAGAPFRDPALRATLSKRSPRRRDAPFSPGHLDDRHERQHRPCPA